MSSIRGWENRLWFCACIIGLSYYKAHLSLKYDKKDTVLQYIILIVNTKKTLFCSFASADLKNTILIVCVHFCIEKKT